jgi:hypothetical protein
MSYMDEITNYLKRIDFQPPDDDKGNLYIYLHNHLYLTNIDYDNEEYRPLKYFKLVLKMIQEERHYESSLF